MDNYNLVRPEHLNHHGTLFGGQLLSWVDECAWMAATRDFPKYSFVTRAMDKIEFKHAVQNGSILKFHSKKFRVGSSSVTYLVEVYEDNRSLNKEILAFSTTVTFVSVDVDGSKIAIEF
ncbi:acyl-CoA thioesterase [Thiospirochaeta perfilievii]|uniref:Acyl-CoA thioesterase n=1 Tax=Thiospirochaeta perfilievii TaxID=252967 RepID=A0A5C1QCP0_9SPIO|nr:acyl-CoA thioesterase [Thiospirochaeta perfilievii]QEN05311.1 acyl-CoA thioesterase [Thiospirochaeta perfilievii]